MPQLLSINKIGLKGLNTDLKSCELPAEFMTYGKNFRVLAHALDVAGGYIEWSQVGVNFYPGHLMHVPNPSGDFWLVPGRNAVYAFDGSTWSNISSAAGYAGITTDQELLWNSCMLGKIPIINNPQHVPEYWSPVSASQVMQPLDFDASNSWANKSYSCKVMRSHLNFLFALNMVEGITELPNVYRWSHPADINGLPFTWDETDNSAIAGRAQIGGEGGDIVDGRSLRNAFAIYSESAINILDYTGDQFVWSRRNLSETIGLASINAINEIKGTQFFIGNDDIMINNGTKVDSIIHNRMRKRLLQQINIDRIDRSYIVRNNAYKELWFCVPEDGADYPNIAYVYNWKDDAWAIRDIVTGIAHCNYGLQVEPAALWNTIPSTEQWDNYNLVWSFTSSTFTENTVVGVQPSTGKLFLMDPETAPDADIETILERTNFPLIDQRQVTTITRVYPKIEGTQPMEIQFGSQDFAGAPIRWKDPVTFQPCGQRKIDIRTTGEFHCWRIKSIGDGKWSLSGMEIEFELNGVR